MQVVRSRAEMLDARSRATHDVAAVLTMGALHAGHLALAAEARREVGDSGSVVMTVFVNPLQFGPTEDLDTYPRALDDDIEAARAAGVDVLYAPQVSDVYPAGPATVTIDPGELGSTLEGAARPTHFRGVLTVVAKLLNVVGADVTVFGEKDYQQLVLVRRMCVELDLGVRVVGLPTVREPDGLAMSSRNTYLSTSQRAAAVSLWRALRAGQDAAVGGTQAALTAAHGVLDARPEVDVDYLVVTDPDLRPAPRTGPARMLVAARVGTTRLLDNVPLTIGAPA